MSEEPKGKVYHGEEGIKQMLYDERKATVDHFWDLSKKNANNMGMVIYRHWQ